MSNLLSLFSSVLKPKGMEFIEAKNLTFDAPYDGIIPLNITVVLKNPNNLNIHLESAELNIYCRERELGTSREWPDMEIVANDKFELPLKILMSAQALKELIRNDFLNILTEGNIKIPFVIKGKAKVKKFGFCLDIPLEFTKEIELSLEKLLGKIKL